MSPELRRFPISIGIDVLKQFLTRHVLAASDDPRQLFVSEIDIAIDATFTPKTKPDFCASDPYVTTAQSGQAEGIVFPGILEIANSDQCGFQQPHDSSDNFGARQAGKRQVSGDACPQQRQDTSDVNHPAIFGLIANLTPA